MSALCSVHTFACCLLAEEGSAAAAAEAEAVGVAQHHRSVHSPLDPLAPRPCPPTNKEYKSISG